MEPSKTHGRSSRHLCVVRLRELWLYRYSDWRNRWYRTIPPTRLGQVGPESDDRRHHRVYDYGNGRWSSHLVL